MISTLLDALSMPGDYTRGLLAGRPGERVGGNDLLRNYGVEIDNPILSSIADFGVNLATDPLTYILPTAAGAATKSVKNFLKPGVAKLLPARRNFTVVKNVQKGTGEIPAGMVGSIDDGVTYSGRAVPLPDASNPSAFAKRVGVLDQYPKKLAGDMPEAAGVYNVNDKVAAIGSHPGARETLRHEVAHGIRNQPNAPGIFGFLHPGYEGAGGFRKGLGMLADEALANYAERRKLSDVWNFFANPHQGYGDILRNELGSPLLASLYMNAPNIGMGAAGLGTLGALGAGAAYTAGR